MRPILDDVFIAELPVTGHQYLEYLNDIGRADPEAAVRRVPRRDPEDGFSWRLGPDGRFQPPAVDREGDRHDLAWPVLAVSWDDAVAYCECLSKQSTNRRYLLPSEAEWEKAASWEPSGGEGTGKKRIYPWGDEAPDETRCNFGMNVGDTTPVGRYSPQGDSPYGCADMAGNVWEWCADWYDEKAYKERQGEGIKDPQGPGEPHAADPHGAAANRGIHRQQTAW